MPVVLAMDQGTTSSRSMVYNEAGRVMGTAQRELPPHYPRPGWVEHDPDEIWETQRDTMLAALSESGAAADDVAAIGLTNQRETTVVWDRQSGRPIGPAIVWQDRRTADACDDMRQRGLESVIQQKTGLVLDAYFSASKIRWLLDQTPDARARAERGELLFGTVDTWLIWKLTAGGVHVTDVTNASRTMLFNLETQAWDDELLAMFDIPAAMMPRICSSSEVVGETAAAGLPKGIPIAGVAGDQQAALFGQTCFDEGFAKTTYGTGCFLLMNVGRAPRTSSHRLVNTVAWRTPAATTYAIEGSVFIGGAVVQWLRDGLGLIRSADEVESLAASVPDNGGVNVVPAFAGLGAPHWDQRARGIITGLTGGVTKAHIARASLEGIAHQVADVFEVMRGDAGVTMTELRVDGAAACNNLLMQFQADLLGMPVVRPLNIETTALGAAMLAGLATGVWPSLDALRDIWQIDRTFEPSQSGDAVEASRATWKRALDRARDWDQDDVG